MHCWAKKCVFSVCVGGGGCLTVQKNTHDATSEGGIVETFRNFCFRLDET